MYEKLVGANFCTSLGTFKKLEIFFSFLFSCGLVVGPPPGEAAPPARRGGVGAGPHRGQAKRSPSKKKGSVVDSHMELEQALRRPGASLAPIFNLFVCEINFFLLVARVL